MELTHDLVFLQTQSERVKPNDLPLVVRLLNEAHPLIKTWLAIHLKQVGSNFNAWIDVNWNCYINPKYKPMTPFKNVSNEDCLSDQTHKIHPVKRHSEIKATWQTLDWDWYITSHSKVLKWLQARVFQHETDHWQGKVIFLPPLISE